MSTFDVSVLADHLLPTGLWASALLHALVRDEHAGRRPARLTEPKLATWARFRGRLSSSDLLALLFEDAAVIHRLPFDDVSMGHPIRAASLPELVVDGWLAGLAAAKLELSSADYGVEQARHLGITTKLARKDLQVVKPHQKVLELPGTGGQLAHHLVRANPGVTMQDNFVVACSTWQEVTLAGVLGLDVLAPNSDFIVRLDSNDLRGMDHPLRQRAFDYVVGLSPEKGGALQAAEQLSIWFPSAKILLV